MAYKAQYYPGATSVAANRRKHMSGKLEKLREISDEDLTAILGHRAPGSDYPSTHPPLAEIGEPADSARDLVEATPGAKAGDRVRYVQFTDSMYNAPATPYFRSYFAAINFRGVDPGTLSGRQIVEARERDMEKCAKVQMETEISDPTLRHAWLYCPRALCPSPGRWCDVRHARQEKTRRRHYYNGQGPGRNSTRQES